jgi:hypothetical protein
MAPGVGRSNRALQEQVMGWLEDLLRFGHDETGANRNLATDQPATPRPNVE